MKDEANFYKGLLDQLYDGVYTLDRRRRITYWNRGAERISGFAQQEVIGRPCMDNILIHVDEHGNSLCKDNCPAAHTMMDGQVREKDIFLHHKDGHRVPVSVRVSPMYDETGNITGAVEIFSDNSTKLAALQRVSELEHSVLLDPLTGVGNRRFFETELEAQINAFKRHAIPFGLLFIDVDHFKQVNDTHGHAVGDRVLKMTAETLVKNIRSFEFLGRLGGEEFGVIAVNVDEARLQIIAEKLRALTAASVLTTDNGAIRITISIGATFYHPDDNETSALERADQLMYRSKTEGRNRVTLG